MILAFNDENAFVSFLAKQLTVVIRNKIRYILTRFFVEIYFSFSPVLLDLIF